MRAHLFFISTLHALRAVAALVLAGVFLYFSDRENIPVFSLRGDGPVRAEDISLSRYHAVEPGDTTAFLIVGLVLASLALVRLALASYSFLALGSAGGRHWRRGILRPRILGASRKLGLALAFLDLIDLTLFPITTACGLYGWLVYRHADTIDFFEPRYAPT